MLYENQLKACLLEDTQTKKIFIGTFAKNELPTFVNYPCCLIINTHPRYEVGEHWLALFINQYGYGDFFDSFGFHPRFYGLDTYIDKITLGYEWNKNRIQGLSALCGYYCLLYLLFRVRNRQNYFFNSFTKNYKKNDLKLIEMINKYE